MSFAFSPRAQHGVELMVITPLSLFFSILVALASPPDSFQEITIDRAGIVIKHNTRIKPGTYRVQGSGEEGVLVIDADGVVLDFNGAELVGCEEDATRDGFSGIAVIATGRHRVTIKNARIRGFKTAILVQEGRGLAVENCDLSGNFAQRLASTPMRENSADWLWPHENDEDQWRKNYGAGIYLKGCTQAVIRRNVGKGSQNGILLSRCEGCEVYDNDFSFNSGWGLALWRSCKNIISHNKFDWCVRGYSHGVYWRGQDSTGILIFEQCSDNFFGWNSATHGGDGFFLYAGNETLRRTGKGGCNRNVLYRNDFSHAVANGIEATFSDSNLFIENICNDCQHGFWTGYSYNTWIAGNRIEDCSGAGIAWEHGHDNLIEGNRFARNPVAIDLWWDYDKDLMETPYGKRVDTDSRNNRVLHNVFLRDKTAVRLRESQKTSIEENLFVTCEENIAEDSKCSATRSRDNRIIEDASQLDRALQSTAIDEHSRSYHPPETAGSLEAILPEGARRGRQYILIDEWGPYDFKAPKVWPNDVIAGREARFFLYGPEGSFEVTQVPAGLTVGPLTGSVPGQFTVRAEKPGYRAFEIGIETGGRLMTAWGTLLSTEWTVEFFQWTPDQDPREHPEAWRKLLAGTPRDTLQLDALGFQWQGGQPTPKVQADHFATVAQAAIDLPAGTYTFVTVSDDGIRLWVDGELIIDNWTWHPPTEDRATVDLEKGIHEVKIEHFEIDGWAALSFALEH